MIDQKCNNMDLDKISTSYFFTDFPEDWTSKSMWSFFNLFGIVVDIFVPQKRSKAGRPFGFARYKGVQEFDVLTTKVRSIAVGADPITFNVAKFQRNHNTFPFKASVRKGNQPPTPWKKLPPTPPKNNESFVNIL